MFSRVGLEPTKFGAVHYSKTYVPYNKFVLAIILNTGQSFPRLLSKLVMKTNMLKSLNVTRCV